MRVLEFWSFGVLQKCGLAPVGCVDRPRSLGKALNKDLNRYHVGLPYTYSRGALSKTEKKAGTNFEQTGGKPGSDQHGTGGVCVDLAIRGNGPPVRCWSWMRREKVEASTMTLVAPSEPSAPPPGAAVVSRVACGAGDGVAYSLAAHWGGCESGFFMSPRGGGASRGGGHPPGLICTSWQFQGLA